MKKFMDVSENTTDYFGEYYFKMKKILKKIALKTQTSLRIDIFRKNLELSSFSFDAYDTEHLNFLLYENGIFYEIFASYKEEEFFSLDEKILKNILQWKLKIVFLEDFSKIVILNEDNFPEKIEKVIN